MKRKIELGTAIFFMMVSAILACLITYTFLTSKITTSLALAKKYEKLNTVDKLVNSKFISDIDSSTSIEGMIEGYISSIDKYGAYMGAEEYQEFQNQSKGKYVGLGITVRSMTGLIKIVKVQPGSPAALANIMPGDVIYKINTTLLENIEYSEATAMLTGKKGSEVSLGIYRGQEMLEKKLVFAEFTSTSVEYEMVDLTVGCIRIDRFEENTPKDFEGAYKALQQQGMQSLIVDVRNNTGGELSSVCSVLDYLLPEGNLVTIKNKSGSLVQTFTSDADSVSIPIAVLINGESYSAAELFAATIRDFQKGKLIGENTFGKGMAQEVLPLGDGTALYLSTLLYYPPSGENFDEKGVAPDETVTLTDEQQLRFYELTPQEDPQLQHAIATLKGT